MIRIEDVTEKDAQALLEIYAPYVLNTAITFEYEVPSAEEFRTRIRTTVQKYPYIKAVDSCGEVVGYAYAGPFHVRRAYDWSVETSIYVSTGQRGEGIGRVLYEELEKRAKAQGILNMNACIGVPRSGDDPYLTDASVRFHEKMGYRMVGTFHSCGFKFGRWYDMCWMEKLIGDHADEPKERPFREEAHEE